ncbi:MAG TPA: TIGR03000 domain-containing protein [Gemmataceae bacterium]|jgi:uncharacterized protein (TIGR03000 family)|nr:TIGR03000 domain-containing protein [Gemmataceae bacterium]
MKRLLVGSAAVVLALVMNGAARADGHGNGHGHGGEGGHGNHEGQYWYNPWGDQVRYNEWENRWYGNYGSYRYFNSYPGYANSWYGYGNNPLYGYGNYPFNAFPGSGLGAPGFVGTALRSAGYLAPGYGATGMYAPAYPAAPGLAAAPAAPVPMATNLPPRMQVVVPNPEAQVTIGGQKMESLGTVRTFELPPVDQGKSETYKVTATWVQDGQTITDVRKVAVTAGSVAQVDFTQPAPPERVATPVKSEPDTQNVSTPKQNGTPP